MTINEFAKMITQLEGLKQEVNIAQVKEILKVTNGLVNKELYKLIKATK